MCTKLAKCGKHTQTECYHKFKSIPECRQCTLVKHRFEPLYKEENGIKYKLCPHCGKYVRIFYFKTVKGKISSWCRQCASEYQLNWQYDKYGQYTIEYNDKTLVTTQNKIASEIKKLFLSGINQLTIKKNNNETSI